MPSYAYAYAWGVGIRVDDESHIRAAVVFPMGDEVTFEDALESARRAGQAAFLYRRAARRAWNEVNVASSDRYAPWPTIIEALHLKG